MTLHLISGLEGTGKSTLCDILNARGYPALDSDSCPNLCVWVNNVTGLSVPVQQVPFPYSDSWTQAHTWMWDQNAFREISERYRGQQAFLCGSAANEVDYYASFGLRFYLWANDSSVIRRLQHRAPYQWRYGSADLTRRLIDNRSGRTDAILKGFVLLYADLPAEQLATDVIAYVVTAKNPGSSLHFVSGNT